MTWTVLFHDAFDVEFEAMVEDLQDELLAHANLLAAFGPHLGRPTVDTLKGSRHTNMKEIRFFGMVRFGAWPLLSIPNDKRSCWLVEIKVGQISAGSTSAYSRWPMRDTKII